MSDQLPDLLASDAERERAVEQLRTAATEGRLTVDELEERLRSAYAARTRKELELLVADVTVQPSGGAGAIARPGTSGLTVRAGPGGDQRILSIMSGHERRGRWRIAKRCTVVNVMGGSDIDLNDAELSDPVTELKVVSVMGGGEIRVPDGVDVVVSEFALMGANDVRLGDQSAPPGGPQIRIHLVSIMSGISVRRGRKPTREERRRERDLRKGEGPSELDA